MFTFLLSVLRKLRKNLSKLRLSLVAAVVTYRDGGIATVSISKIEYGNMLKDKRILITGGTSGIGYSLAKKCVSLGGNVVVTGRNQEKIDQAILRVNNPRFMGLAWDISDIAVVDEKLEECNNLLGGDIDVLVNNAGVIDTTNFLDVSETQWDLVYSINSKGVFFLTQAICQGWISRGARRKKIINVSSQAGFVGATYPYRMSKWDVAGLTRGLGLKLCGKGIIVNGIAPGIVATEMQPKTLKQRNNIYSPYNPLKRFALPEEIAELGVFLISDASNFIVGQTIVCDGGFSIK